MSDYRVDRSKWEKMHIFEQMGNISSEVGRSFSYLRRNDQEMAQNAMIRAIDLFDATSSALVKDKSPRVKELLRAKEEYLEVFYENKDSQAVEKYFTEFAIASRLKH